jgi:hypothetical protein
MNNQKQELINDVLTGLLVAAAFTAVIPVDVLAQNLADAGNAADKAIMTPFVQFTSYIAYGIGTVMTVAGIAGCKKHSDSPTNNPLAPALGRLGAGAAFLSAPAVAGMLAGTSLSTGGSGIATFNGIGGF